MSRLKLICGLAALLLSTAPGSFAAAPPAAKGPSGTIVIVFKDGHRQVFNLTDIARVDLAGTTAYTAGTQAYGSSKPARGQFVGRWVVGEGNGMHSTFIITLNEDGNATRFLHGDVHGTWSYVNGDALITWDDGAKDAIRKVGSAFQKYAYGDGKSFTDTPDNVTEAQNTTPKPI
jgi:hypothetical protein